MEGRLAEQDAKREVDGFFFYTEKDALLAAREHKKIEYLKARIDYDNPEGVLNIYKKAVQDRVFKTPAGLFFLKEIQEYLYNADLSEEIPPILVYTQFDGAIRENMPAVRKRIISPKKKENRLEAMPFLIITNIALAAAVVAMFLIALHSDTPNIMNYEKVIINRYAEWEQELTEREQIIREKERSYNIEENSQK